MMVEDRMEVRGGGDVFRGGSTSMCLVSILFFSTTMHVGILLGYPRRRCWDVIFLCLLCYKGNIVVEKKLHPNIFGVDIQGGSRHAS